METPELTLTTSAYWESEGIDVRINPKRGIDSRGLKDFLERDCGLRGAIVVATSGSTGIAKFVVLRKAAILASAEAVNTHCGLSAEDHWLCALPTFHVGGLGIFARAYCSGAGVTALPWDDWSENGSAWFQALVQCRATVTSLTPTHVFDLVAAGRRGPDSLRGLFLGGGHIDPALVGKALDLGWPIWPTYGMSEAASQIATALDGTVDWLPILPHWECSTDKLGRLRIRGKALFAGYATHQQDVWEFCPTVGDTWFTTGDVCEISNLHLRFLHRSDDAVKISGELVSLSRLNERAATLGIPGTIVAVPHPRKEHELVLTLAPGSPQSNWLELFNTGLPTLEQARRLQKR